MTEKNDQPDVQCCRSAEGGAALKIVGDVFAGTLRLRARRAEYLPMWEVEEVGDYAKRVAQAVLHNAFARTVTGLAGMLFRREPQLGDDVPDPVRGRDGVDGHSESIDNAGTHLSVFLHERALDAIRDGLVGWIVDYPAVDWGSRRPTLADIAARRLRPYWVPVCSDQLLDRRTTVIDGRVVVSRIRYKYCTTRNEGEFGQSEVERIKEWVLDLDANGQPSGVSWREFEKGDNGWTRINASMLPLPVMEIPWCEFRTTRNGEPPLLDLALENIAHYQVRSDRANNLSVCGTPIPIFRGRRTSSGVVKVGVTSGVDVEADGGAEYLEPAGSALEHSRTELLDIEKRMAVLGIAMLAGETRQAETATSKRIDQAQADSNLMAWATRLQDAAEQGLRFHAIWLALAAGKRTAEAMNVSGGSLTINRDFQEYLLDPQTLAGLLNAVVEGKLTLESFLIALKNGLGRLLEFLDPEAEVAKLGAVEVPPTLEIAA